MFWVADVSDALWAGSRRTGGTEEWGWVQQEDKWQLYVRTREVEAKAVEDKHAERAHSGASLSRVADVEARHRVPKTRAAREESSTGAERSTLRT